MMDLCRQNKIYPVVFITDDNYSMPTAVAITSLYYNKSEDSDYSYHIYVICDNVSSDNLNRLMSLSKKDFEVTIIKDFENLFTDMTAVGVEHVSSSALLKFELPNIFSQYDRLLYLDGDTIVTKDLSGLFETDIEGRYAAVVKDYNATQYVPPQLVKLKISHKHNSYWNSGMMLLNLKKLREDNITKKLYDYRINGLNWFMDQDALNVVFEENIKYVSFCYNTITEIVRRYSPDDIAEYYGIKPYKNIEEILGRASVLHLAGQYKPWEHLVPFLSDIYSFYYSKSPYAYIPLKLIDNDELTHYSTDEVIPIVYLIDNPNAKHAAISIASLIYNKRPETRYDISLICHGVDPTRIVRFQAISAKNVRINIIRPDYSRENFIDQYGDIKKTSLISRLKLPELLPQYNKVIFLSPTNMISKDLTDLYCQNVEGYVAGASLDFRQRFKKHCKRLGIVDDNYYNTSVMLYNLKYFRDNSELNTELMHYIKYGINVFEYQDAFNVCAGKVTRCLSYYFNALDNVFDLLNKPIDTANMLGVKRYSSLTELFSRAYIVNFCGKIKPWSDIYPVFTDAYLRYFLRSVFCDYLFNNILDEKVEKIRRSPDYIVAQENQTDDVFYNRIVFNNTIPKGEYTEYVYRACEEWSEDSVYLKYGNVTPQGFNKQPREKRIIVSLTTIPFRIKAAALVVAIMMHQTMKPDEIVVNLGREFFKDTPLPKLLLDEEKCGVKINYCRDLYCHTKYFHTMQAYPDDIVITVDDDILYEETLIEDLYNSYVAHPDCISAMRTHLITFDKNNRIAPYIDWKYCCADYIDVPSHRLMATGVGGVLYPPHLLSSETFNMERLLEVCPKADDVWLKVMEIISDVKVVLVKRTDPLVFIGETQDVGLCDNVSGGRNDEQLERTLEKYNIIDDENTVISRLLNPCDILFGSLSLTLRFNELIKRNREVEKVLTETRNLLYAVEQTAKDSKDELRALSGKARYFQRENELIRISLSFRIGRAITWLPRKIIGFFTHNKNR